MNETIKRMVAKQLLLARLGDLISDAEERLQKLPAKYRVRVYLDDLPAFGPAYFLAMHIDAQAKLRISVCVDDLGEHRLVRHLHDYSDPHLVDLAVYIPRLVDLASGDITSEVEMARENLRKSTSRGNVVDEDEIQMAIDVLEG